VWLSSRPEGIARLERPGGRRTCSRGLSGVRGRADRSARRIIRFLCLRVLRGPGWFLPGQVFLSFSRQWFCNPLRPHDIRGNYASGRRRTSSHMPHSRVHTVRFSRGSSPHGDLPLPLPRPVRPAPRPPHPVKSTAALATDIDSLFRPDLQGTLSPAPPAQGKTSLENPCSLPSPFAEGGVG
jgi:hypothetical protein